MYQVDVHTEQVFAENSSLLETGAEGYRFWLVKELENVTSHGTQMLSHDLRVTTALEEGNYSFTSARPTVGPVGNWTASTSIIAQPGEKAKDWFSGLKTLKFTIDGSSSALSRFCMANITIKLFPTAANLQSNHIESNFDLFDFTRPWQIRFSATRALQTVGSAVLINHSYRNPGNIYSILISQALAVVTSELPQFTIELDLFFSQQKITSSFVRVFTDVVAAVYSSDMVIAPPAGVSLPENDLSDCEIVSLNSIDMETLA